MKSTGEKRYGYDVSVSSTRGAAAQTPSRRQGRGPRGMGGPGRGRGNRRGSGGDRVNIGDRGMITDRFPGPRMTPSVQPVNERSKSPTRIAAPRKMITDTISDPIKDPTPVRPDYSQGLTPSSNSIHPSAAKRRNGW